jgi:Tfp pilus assembly protein PilX
MTHNNEFTTLTRKRREDRGVALVTALLILMLFTVMTLSMVIATSSDMLIDGYYRNARGSFYAADSGLSAVRQDLLNDINNNDLPTGYVPSSGAPHLVITNALPSDITSSSSGFGAYQSILGSSSSGSAASWPGAFKIDTTTDGGTTISMANSASNPAVCNAPSTTPITITIDCVYTYSYHLVIDGQSRGGEVNVVEEYGQIPFTVHMKAVAAPPVPASQWSTLLDQYGLCSGAFVPGTMSGKMFSNGSWNFGSFATRYIFNGNIGAHDANVGYMYNDGTCDQTNATSDSHSGTTINPTFSGGLTTGLPTVSLPTDNYSQLQAVLDGSGEPNCTSNCTQPANSALSNVLENPAGTPWSSASSSGVYLPYNKSAHSLNVDLTTQSFGGIYVQGNVAQMTLSASTATISGTTYNTQVIQIVQGGTTTTVTVALPTNPNSPATGFTRIQDNSSNDSGWLTGSPANVNTSPTTEGLLVYTTGNISSNPTATAPTGLSGPSSGPAIQNGSGVTITSGGIISITGNLTYSTEPVSLNVSDTPVSPAPTNVLGIYTNGGNVQLQPPTNVASMEIDASIATIKSGSSFGITATWNSITNVNIVGGRVQNMALNGSSIGARNIYFDQRFANGVAPPWFPTVVVPGPTVESATPEKPAANRLSWVNTSAQ